MISCNHGIASTHAEGGLLFACAISDLRSDDFKSAEAQFRLLVNHPLIPDADRPSMDLYLSWAVLGQELKLQQAKIMKVFITVITQSLIQHSTQLSAKAEGGVSKGAPRPVYDASRAQKLAQAEIAEVRRLVVRIGHAQEQSKALFRSTSWQPKGLEQMNTKVQDDLAFYCKWYDEVYGRHKVSPTFNALLGGGTRFSQGIQQWRPSSVPPVPGAREAWAITGNNELKATAEASSMNYKVVQDCYVENSHATWSASEYDTNLASLMAKAKVEGAGSIGAGAIGGDYNSVSIRRSPLETFRPASAPPSDSMLDDSGQSVAAKHRPYKAGVRLNSRLRAGTLMLPQGSDLKWSPGEAAVRSSQQHMYGTRPSERSPARESQTTTSGHNRGLGSALAEPDFTNFDVRIHPDTPRGETAGVKRWFERHKNEVQSFMEAKRHGKCDKVKVAIFDTGFEADNSNPFIQELWRDIDRKRRWKSWVSNPAIMEDANGHGTHCALSLHKIAPAAELYIGRVCVNGHDLTGETVEEAITHCVNEWNVDILSMSFGLPHGSAALRALAPAIEHAAKHKTLMFAAAGNGGMGNPRIYPAGYDNVFSIFSACDNGKPSDSNPNPRVRGWNFYCLGEHVTMPRSGAPNKTMSGSSVATPIAAGFAALVLEFYRQPKIAGQHAIREPDKLKTIHGMSAVFLKMIQHDAEVITDPYGPWRPIEPWNLLAVPLVHRTGDADLELEQRRVRVPMEINKALESI